MDCIEVQNKLVAFIHGELTKETIMEIHQHLSRCKTCLQEEIEFRMTNQLLSQYQFAALPDDFEAELHRKLSKIKQPRRKVTADFKRIVYAIAATIIIMIGIQFFGYQIMRSARQPVHFVDFPATRAVFKPAEQRLKKQTSLKERFAEKYFHASRGKTIKLKRD